MRIQELPSQVRAFFQLEGPADFLGGAGGFSGACFWKLQQGDECWGIRRWPREHPTVSRLKWIHAVLKHSRGKGFLWLPEMRTSPAGESFTQNLGLLWECSCWMPGTAALGEDPSSQRIATAMEALARFHQSVEEFLPEQGRQSVPAVESREVFFRQLATGMLDQIQSSLPASDWPDLNRRANQFVEMFSRLKGQLEQRFVSATGIRTRLFPCLRDIRQQHVLFVGDRVSSFIDFGAMRIDSVATDIARLLGSVSRSGEEKWSIGFQAYQAVCPLDDEELELVDTLELANRAMSGLQWLSWILLEGRQFEDRQGVISRLDELLLPGPID
jgi:hypothetical protein